MHRNLTWRTSRGLQLDAGAYLAALEAAAGVEATVIGKPSAAMFEAALTTLGLDPSETAMIGDDLDSDISAAHNRWGRRGCRNHRKVPSGATGPG